MMVWNWIVWFFCTFLGFCGPVEESPCRMLTHAGIDHSVCSYAVDDIRVRFFLNTNENLPFKTLRRLEEHLESTGQKPMLLVNGGMYHENLHPVGLYVEAGQKIQKVSTKGGWGNFHLLPNGIFWVQGDNVGITTTKGFIAQKQKVDFATQSGPMLVIEGKLHPRFIQNSDSLKIRNGVGLSQDGKTVHFAMTQRPSNFWNFATLFQKKLKAHNALFLDGTVSSIRTKGFRRSTWRNLGPMIGVFKR